MAQIPRSYCTGAATDAGNAAWVRLPHCAGADMGAVLGDHRRTWLGQIKHLARGMTRGHHCRQRRSAAGTAFGIMINHNVRRNDLPQGLARMPLLPAAELARWLAQAPGPRRLLQPIARWWLATVAAVEAEPALQLGDPALQAFNQLLQRGVLGQQPLDVRFQGIFGFARRIGPIRRLSHWQLDSRRYPSRQAISSRTWAVTAEQTQLDCSGAPPPLYFRCIFSGGPSHPGSWQMP